MERIDNFITQKSSSFSSIDVKEDSSAIVFDCQPHFKISLQSFLKDQIVIDLMIKHLLLLLLPDVGKQPHQLRDIGLQRHVVGL